MNIETLRNIGKQLRQEIPPLAVKPHGTAPIGKGAGGDMTFAVDKKAEEIIFKEIEKLNEPVTLVSEEHGIKDIKGGGPNILIDPIDGSKNAVSGIPFFSTSIAIVNGDTLGHISMGYVINLINGDEFWAEKGKGSFLNGVPVRTQEDEVLNVIAYEAQTPKVHIPEILPLLSLFRRTRCLGSTALDLALLAAGAVSVFVAPAPSRSFDHAAGYLLVREAGGIITDLNGEDIDSVPVGIKRTVALLASGNKKLHFKALAALKRS
ncbi:MAG TPA: hypothetical protein ENG95_05005 [Nitrospirae bacterium]|nr:inositol-1-monophosphatase [bacterium BMS3Abin10]GBE38978.1 inositol-1-monophosphatase [bacterium BMS3Bbin08]HDH51163.1 hypothetical protein [Nitrospirota bacterium]HDK81047.1 hypothetical protein [Nitrospirota bacterium]HDO25978.1 hypothetical protein [Nitrospirota bacterium]